MIAMSFQALAQDQLRALSELTGENGTRVGMGVYDGDTNQDLRLRLRDSGRLVRLPIKTILYSRSLSLSLYTKF